MDKQEIYDILIELRDSDDVDQERMINVLNYIIDELGNEEI